MANPDKLNSYSRRDFLKLAGVTAAGAALAACDRRTSTPTNPVPEAMRNALESIGSPSRSLDFITSGLDLFNQKLTTIVAGNTKIPINAPGVLNFTQDPDVELGNINGTFNARANKENTHPFFPTTAQEIRLPYLVLSNKEIEQLETNPDVKFADKYPLISINFPTTASIIPGLNPRIEIKVATDINLNSLPVKFVFTKEIATAAVIRKLYKQTAEICDKFGLNFNIDGHEVMTSIIDRQIRAHTRLAAIIDVAPAIIAIWAWSENPEMVRSFRTATWGNLIDNLISIAPTQNEDPYQKAINLLLANPTLADRFPHVGDYSKIP